VPAAGYDSERDYGNERRTNQRALRTLGNLPRGHFDESISHIVPERRDTFTQQSYLFQSLLVRLISL
jgi:hypothetical protein